MQPTLLLLAGLAVPPSSLSDSRIEASEPPEAIQVEARLEAPDRLVVDFELAPGWTVPHNALLPPGPPAAIVRLDPPVGLTVAGERPQTLTEELAAFFLDLPEERLLELGENEILLVPSSALAPDAVLALDVVLYAVPPRSEGVEGVRLLRRRLELPLRSGARAVPVTATTSALGGRDAWRIGDRVSDFHVTTPQGELALAELLGKGPVVVTTQRSCL